MGREVCHLRDQSVHELEQTVIAGLGPQRYVAQAHTHIETRAGRDYVAELSYPDVSSVFALLAFINTPRGCCRPHLIFSYGGRLGRIEDTAQAFHVFDYIPGFIKYNS